MHTDHNSGTRPTTGARHSRRGLLRAAGALAAVLPLAGAVGAGAANAAAYPLTGARPGTSGRPAAEVRRAGGQAIAALNASPTSWDLQKSDWVTWQGVSSLYDMLLTLDDKDQLQPGLVTSWSVSEDGLAYDLKLRDGVTFHDGTPFNAEALKSNVNRILSKPESRYYEYFKHVDHVETPDPLSAKIVMGDYQADFPYTGLAGWGSLQISPQAWERLGDRYSSGPVGTGPFTFKAYEPDSYIEYGRNDNYWAGRPLLDGLRLRIIPEANIRLTELLGRGVDIVYNVDPKDVQALKDAGIVVEQRTAPGAQMISLNTAQWPTSELAVRKAIARAIDRETIISKVLYGYAEKSRAGAPSNSPWYNADIPYVDYDLDEAGKILDAAGWMMGSDGIRYRDGQPLSVNIISTDSNNWAINNQIIQEQIRAIGIDSKIESFEWGALLDRWRENQGNWHVSYHSQAQTVNATTPIPAAWQPDTFWNVCQIKRATDPQLMQVAEQLRAADKAWQATADVEKRRTIGKQVQSLYQDNQLVVWLWHTQSLNGISPRLKNYQMIFNGRIVWFTTAEVG